MAEQDERICRLDRKPGSIYFWYRTWGHGWATARFIEGDREVFFPDISDLGGGIEVLCEAVIRLLDGYEIARAEWESDLGQWRWRFRRDDGELHIAILDGITTFNNQEDDGLPVFYSGACRLLDFAVQVRDQMQAELDEFGDEGYRLHWGGYPFPVAELRRLDGLIGAARSAQRRAKR